MSDHNGEAVSFRDLSLIPPVIQALDEVGYEAPSPIQAAIIPYILDGRDVLGQAQTGTGKTAAFALPLLSMIDVSKREPQAMVLAPTRELAIQVAEAFQRYASHIKGFHVLPIYGGQDYGGQLRQLKRGPHVIVGTPGRVMDHMRRGTLNLKALRFLVLDEADEMLRMGFIDDVEWILSEIPEQRQIALFSATMPPAIRKISERYLNNPAVVAIKQKTATASTIAQRYWVVSGYHKLDALTRILEVETFDGIIIFVRTKASTVELAEKLEARGYSAAALNGDIPQNQRERTVDRLKKGKIDILVATDVAARGLDVERITHVINYDVPYDTEAYIHRIGRTGRAGRKGEALLFIAPREKRMLYSIEKATQQKIKPCELPSTEDVNIRRSAKFMQQITDTLSAGGLDDYLNLITQYEIEHNVSATDIAAALAKLAQGDTPLLLDKNEKPQRQSRRSDRDNQTRPRSEHRGKGAGRPQKQPNDRKDHPRTTSQEPPAKGMERFRLEVGKQHGAKPGNIVGAIANEGGLEGKYINHVNIFDDYSTVDLPEGMPNEIFRDLKKARVAGQALRISRLKEKRKPGKKPKT